MTEVRGKRVLVVGLARTGYAAARCLSRRGALVTVTDLRPPWVFQSEIAELISQKVGLEIGQHREETFLEQDLVVISPGVPADLPSLEAARRRNIPVIPEIEAASWFLDSRLVGITGSNGKTTTTALVGKMLEASGIPAFVGGNIGVPLISAVDQVAPKSIVVAELSSFQLEIIEAFRPHVAVLLNLTPNHLDRHPSFDAYVRAKAQIFRNQTADDYAILNADDPTVMALAPEIPSRKTYFTRRQGLPEGIVVSDGDILYRRRNLERVLLETREVSLRGDFNVENVLAAAATACLLGADFAALRRAVREFRGVEHRLEYVREIRGVEFFNDSKATSVDATLKALTAFERGVHLILGGKDKGAPYAPLRPLLEDRVRYVYLIGAAAERIAKELMPAAEVIRAGDLQTAIRQAFDLAEPGDLILLSPACSSYDQFQDFEHRGRVFKGLVEQLAREVDTGEAARRRERETTSPECLGVPAAAAGPVPESVSAPGGAPASPIGQAEPPQGVSEVPASEEMGAGGSPAVRAQDESGKGEVDELGEESSAEGEGRAPGQAGPPAPRVKRPELLYVYEVGAEEVDYSGGEPASHDEDLQVMTSDELRPPENVQDEALPFEVRAASVPEGDSPPPGSAPEVAGQSEGREVAPEPAARKPSCQPRLPGL